MPPKLTPDEELTLYRTILGRDPAPGEVVLGNRTLSEFQGGAIVELQGRLATLAAELANVQNGDSASLKLTEIKTILER